MTTGATAVPDLEVTRLAIRDWCREHIPTGWRAAQTGVSDAAFVAFQQDWFQQLRAAGYAVPHWPAEWGGGMSTAEQVVLACPAWVAAPLLHGLDADLAERVSAIPSAPVAVVCTGWAERDVARVERGFGFLVPGREQSPVLGTLFDSWAFPNRAPQGRVLWRTLLGGARAAAVLDLEDPALVNHTLRALEKWLGLRATPEMVRVVRHPRGIPQYPVGHAREVARIDARLERQPGLHLTGNCYRGIAMNACIQEAEALAARVAGAPLPQAASRA